MRDASLYTTVCFAFFFSYSGTHVQSFSANGCVSYQSSPTHGMGWSAWRRLSLVTWPGNHVLEKSLDIPVLVKHTNIRDITVTCGVWKSWRTLQVKWAVSRAHCHWLASILRLLISAKYIFGFSISSIRTWPESTISKSMFISRHLCMSGHGVIFHVNGKCYGAQ
jgi:hypothetical protein